MPLKFRHWEHLRLLIVTANLVGIVVCASDFFKKEFGGLDAVNISFTLIYLVEVLMKIVAMGLTFGPKSFFRVGWNYMDVFIIITGLLFSLIPPLREAKACTIITMFRAFKLAYSTTPMRRLMSPWLHALRKMANVFAVLVFIILTFASTGIGEFGGSRYFRCRTTPAPVDGVWEVDESIYRLCNAHGHGSFDCPAGTYCGTPYDYGLEATHDEMYGSELIAYGAPGYENIMRAFFISFQVATCDDWVKVMYRMQDSDNAILSRLFFPCFIFIGSFLCMNLIVAVIVDTFQNHREALLEKDKLKRSRVRRGHEIRGESSQIALRDNEAPMQEAQEENEFVGGKEAEGKEEEVEASPEQDKEESIDKMAQKNTKSVKTSRIRNKEENESFRALCMKVKESKVYQLTILGLILFNLFILAMNRQGISDTELKVYNIFDVIIAAAFFLEMVVEFNALGPLAYLRTRYIDIVTNVLSVIELVFTWTDNYDSMFIVNCRVLHQGDNSGFSGAANNEASGQVAGTDRNPQLPVGHFQRHLALLHTAVHVHFPLRYDRLHSLLAPGQTRTSRQC